MRGSCLAVAWIGIMAAASAQSLEPTFSDEFDTGILDRTIWTNSYVRTSNFDSDRPAWVPNAFDFLSGKGLRIRFDDRASLGHSWTGGAITTFGGFSQTYGYFEIRAKIPAGQGLWPAFWLLQANQSWPPEIDVFEFQCVNPSQIFLTYHYGTNNTSQGTNYIGPDFSAGYHTYGLSWRPNELIWYIDGVQKFQVTGSQVPSSPMYLLLDLDAGGWKGAPDGTTPSPSYFDVDYVHAFQYSDLMTPPTVPDLAFGKTNASGQDPLSCTIKPGDTINVTGAIVSGNASQASPSVHIVLTSYDGKTTYSDTAIHLATLPPNTAQPFSYAIPYDTSGLAPGVYNVELTVTNPVTHFYTFAGGAPARVTVTPTPLANLGSLGFHAVPGKAFVGSATPVGGGLGMQLQGNLWEAANYSYTVTPATVLEFDFSASNPAEIYGVGLMPNATSYGSIPTLDTYFFQVGGTTEQFGQDNFDHYEVGGGTVHYTIPVGNYFTGPVAQLLLLCRDNAHANGSATFSNVRLYESP